jgi:uncharacterized protein YhhL (DUF1145 family)
MSPTARRIIFLLKIVVALYWAWVLQASISTDRTSFDAIIALSAPLLLSIHFVQGLMFLRWLRGRGPWVTDFAQIMLFGVLHLVPLLKKPRRPPSRS